MPIFRPPASLVWEENEVTDGRTHDVKHTKFLNSSIASPGMDNGHKYLRSLTSFSHELVFKSHKWKILFFRLFFKVMNCVDLDQKTLEEKKSIYPIQVEWILKDDLSVYFILKWKYKASKCMVCQKKSINFFFLKDWS